MSFAELLAEDEGDEAGVHNCEALTLENSNLVERGEHRLTIYRDIIDEVWYIGDTVNYMRVVFCPFCSERLDA